MEDMHELTAEQQAQLLRHELEAVYGSSSYKIGRAITWLPRSLKRGLRYLLHNGPIISAKYIYTYAKYHKIANKNYAYWACLQKKDYPEALKQWFLETNYTHTPLDLDHPKTFSEKTQWLKLHDHLDEKIGPILPAGCANAAVLLDLMETANRLLEHHPINEKRRAEDTKNAKPGLKTFRRKG